MKKLLLLIIGFSLFASVGFCDNQEKIFPISDFSKGQNSHANEFVLLKNQGAECLNVRMNDEYGSLSKRETLLTYLDFGSTAVNSMHRYYGVSATETIITTSTLARIYNSGTATTVNTGLTDGKRWDWVTYKDVAIGTSASDQPIKYDGKTSFTANTDGHRTVGLGCAQLGAPFAELDTGTDLDASSWYQYKVAWYDGTDYFYSTARSNPILTGAAVYNIALTDIPLGPSGTTHRYIYRTLGAADQATVEADTTFYLVGTLANNTVTILADSVTDATADDDAAPTWTTASGGTNATPPTGAYGHIHNERYFIAGNSTYPSDIFWSDQYNPDYFDPLDFERIRYDDGDKITFLETLLGILTIGKTNTIQKFYTVGSSDTDWTLSSPYSFTGCPAPYSVASSPLGIIYLGRHGIYTFNGQSSNLISDAVTDVIADISQINIENTVGYFHDNQYHLAYTSSETGETVNDRELVYDITRDAYVVDTKNINCYESFDAGTDLGVLHSGTSTTDGLTFAHTGADETLSIRYDSQFDAGTYDDTRAYGTENAPIIEIAWDCTIDGWLTELQTKDALIDDINEIGTYLPNANIDRPDTDGTWTSPIYYIQASALDKLYWNENLGPTGDITFNIKTGATTGAMGAWSVAYTNPNGSDISALTAKNYIQFKANLSTTDILYTPNLFSSDGYVIKATYSKVGTAYETEVLSKWRSGWLDFGVPRYQKNIWDVRMYYQGTSGTMTLNLKNHEGDIDRDIEIDLSVDPSDDDEDAYEGTTDEKVYIYRTNMESPLLGRYWMITLSENGLVDWVIRRLGVRYNAENLLDN